MKRLLTIIMVLGLAAMACSFSFGNTDSGDSSTEDSSANTSSTSNVLFEDDFSDVNSGWDRAESENAVTEYQSGGYHIAISSENYGAWTNPYRNFTDVSVSVETSLQGGGEDNAFGIICRYADIQNFYVGMISSDGYYGFFQRNGESSLEFLNADSMEFSDAINLGGGNNVVRLDCIGSTLTLYVNGIMLGSTTDTRLSSGDVGLYAKTFGDASTDVAFDNFVVTQP